MKTVAYCIISVFVLTNVACLKTDSLPPESALNARTIKDIAYGTDPLQKIDLYLPAKRSYNTPVIFLLHGGGFYGGDKSEFSLHSQYLANQGFAVINANYRLVDSTSASTAPPLRLDSKIKITEQLADVRSIINFSDKQAASWIISGTKWGVTGHSAGGTLSLLYAYGSLNSDNKIKVAGNWAGVTDFSFPDESYAESISPFVLEMLIRGVGKPVKNENIGAYMAVSPYFVLKENPGIPTINIRPEFNQIAGTPDISKIQYGAITELLISKNVTNKALEIPEADHSFTKPGNWETVMSETVTFFNKHLNN